MRYNLRSHLRNHLSLLLERGPFQGSLAFLVLGFVFGVASPALAQAPSAPTLVSPSYVALTATPTYTWNAVSGATQYRLYVYRNSTVYVDVWLNSGSVCSGSVCSHTPAVALSTTNYSWKMQAKNGSGTSAWSVIFEFEVAPTNWDGGHCDNLTLGDFNGDGRSDRLCRISGVMNVSLASAQGFLGGFQTPISWGHSSESSPIVADLDRDGRADFIEFSAQDGLVHVVKSLGNAFGPVALWGTATAGGFGCLTEPYVMGTGDFNGDGLLDLFCKTGADGRILVGRNNGSGFEFTQFANYTCDSSGQRVGVVDLDGDGKDDWYCIRTNGMFHGLLSNGTAFESGGFTTYASNCGMNGLQVADLNGDGRPDLACPANATVALSTGNAFLSQGSFGSGGCSGTKTFPADLDGDGIAELVCNMNGTPANDIEVRRWNGTALTTPVTWKSSWCEDKVYGGDFNGDGKTDLLCETDQSVVVAGTSGLVPDLMTEAENGLGGTTVATYTPSTAFPDAHQKSVAFPSTNNPGVRQLLTSLKVLDGRGGEAEVTYSYAGGRINHQVRQFLGYAYVRANSPCISGESLCPYSETWYSQDVPSAGSPMVAQRRDGSGDLLDQVTSTYTNSALTTLPWTSVVTRVDRFTHEGGGSKQTYSTYSYDGYGNRTQEVFSGDASPSGDELQTSSTFVANTSAYIVNRLARTESKVPGGSVLAAQEYLYDGAATYNVAPVKGNLTKVRGLKTGSTYVSRTIAYDTWGNPTSVTDETNRTVTTTYDGTHHLFPLTASNAASETVSTTWDMACGVPTQVTDPNSQVTTAQYDNLCRATRTDYPLGGFEIRSYANLGDPSQQSTRIETPPPSGVSGNDWAESYFDGLGKVYQTRKRGPASNQDIVTDRVYDARGNLASSTAPYYEGSTPQQEDEYEYDSRDRIRFVRHADSTEAETSYGLWSVTRTDENGKSVTAQYDAYGRTLEEERTLSGQPVTTEYSYDPLGRLTGMTDPIGNAWSWTFDALGRNLTRNDPDAGNWTYQYDDAGRLTSQTDAKSQTTTFGYDNVGRQTTKTNAVGTTTVTYSQARSGFFNVGRPTTITSPGTTLKMDHDALGRPVKHTRTLDSVDYVFQKSFDASGRMVGITYPDGDSLSSIQYDEAGRLRVVPGIVTDVDYDAAGRPTQRTNANNTQTTWTYSADRGFLQSIYTTGPALVQNLTYTPDAVGLVTQVTSPVTNEGWSYTYDDLYRVTQATNLTTPANSQNWTYDAIGRITYNSRVGNYTYPAVGQPRPHAPNNVNGGNYTYDANGNLTQGGGRSPAWDAENRITSIGTTAFTYDASGERLKKTATGVTSRYPLGDDYEITNGTVTKYVSIDGLGVVAKRVGPMPTPVTYWLHTDRLGNIQAVTDATGVIAQRRTYRPYGEKIADSTGHVESRGWIDQRQDGETGLTYLHARYYDPQLGTFLSPDPIGPRGGLNSYGYAFGDPANLADRSGLTPDFTFCWPNPNCTGGGGTPGGGGFRVNVPQGTGGNLGPVLDWIGDAIGRAWNWAFGSPQGGSSPGAGPIGNEAEFAQERSFSEPDTGAATDTNLPGPVAGPTAPTTGGTDPPAPPVGPGPGSGTGSGGSSGAGSSEGASATGRAIFNTVWGGDFDYGTANFNYGGLVAWSGSLSFDRNGEFYLSLIGVSIGKAFFTRASGSVTGGWVDYNYQGSREPNPVELLEGWGWSWHAAPLVILGGGRAFSSTAAASEVGGFSPQLGGASLNYTWSGAQFRRLYRRMRNGQ